jgi:hypothetical protein
MLVLCAGCSVWPLLTCCRAPWPAEQIREALRDKDKRSLLAQLVGLGGVARLDYGVWSDGSNAAAPSTELVL